MKNKFSCPPWTISINATNIGLRANDKAIGTLYKYNKSKDDEEQAIANAFLIKQAPIMFNFLAQILNITPRNTEEKVLFANISELLNSIVNFKDGETNFSFKPLVRQEIHHDTFAGFYEKLEVRSKFWENACSLLSSIIANVSETSKLSPQKDAAIFSAFLKLIQDAYNLSEKKYIAINEKIEELNKLLNSVIDEEN